MTSLTFYLTFSCDNYTFFFFQLCFFYILHAAHHTYIKDGFVHIQIKLENSREKHNIIIVKEMTTSVFDDKICIDSS